MFFKFSKKKILMMMATILVVVFGVVGSLFLDKNFYISKNIEMGLVKSKSSISYIWYKFKIAIREEGQSFVFSPSSIKLAASTFFSSQEYYESSSGVGTKTAQSIPVLTYHGLPSEGEGSVNFDSFVSQMMALKEAGWKTITLKQFESYIKGEDEQIPDKSFLLTFDDGRKDTYYPVDPVLKNLGLNAVMFVITGQSLRPDQTVGSTYYLSGFELKKMLKSGRWELGSHTRKGHNLYPINRELEEGHFLSNKLWITEEDREETEDEYRNRISTDLQGSKLDIEHTLGIKINSIAFPFSDFGEQSINFKDSVAIVKELTNLYYEFAFYQPDTSKGDSFNYPNDEFFMMKRIGPAPYLSATKLVEIMESGRAKDLPYESDGFGIEWRKSWGKVNHGQSMKLEATENTTGAAVALDGSYLWEDYIFEADVVLLSKGNVSLVARYKNNDNYLTCDFSDKRISLKQRIDGVLQTEAVADRRVSLNSKMVIGIRVEGNGASCFIDQEQVLESPMSEKFERGGIGIHVWSELVGRAKVSVYSVVVKEI